MSKGFTTRHLKLLQIPGDQGLDTNGVVSYLCVCVKDDVTVIYIILLRQLQSLQSLRVLGDINHELRSPW